MARDRANIRTDIWADSHWRSLSHGAQWLYHFILESASLNLCGVADWRPAKWSGMSSDVTAQKIEMFARELEREHFIVVDRETEEVCIRSFFRHDGILSQPNPMKGAAREFAAIGSELIRGVISHELNRLREEFPEGIGKSNVWDQVGDLRTLLKTPPIDIRNPSENPSGNPSGNPSDTSTSTSTSKESAPAVRDEDFERAYSHWPKKVARKEAFDRFKTAVKKRGLEQLVADIIRFGDAYAASTDRQFVPALGAWLNKERWTDELPGARQIGGGQDIRNGFLFVNGRPVIGGPNGMNRDQYDAWEEQMRAGARRG